MPNPIVGIVFDLIELALNSPVVYNLLQERVAAEGRTINLDDLRVLQSKLVSNQAELGDLIAAMPDDPGSHG